METINLADSVKSMLESVEKLKIEMDGFAGRSLKDLENIKKASKDFQNTYALGIHDFLKIDVKRIQSELDNINKDSKILSDAILKYIKSR